MGKKKQFKKIHKAVQDMPSLMRIGVKAVERTTGADLIAAGVKEVGGKPVDPQANYRQIERGPVTINHERRMKKIYMERGIAGVNQYIREVFHFAKMEEIRQQNQQLKSKQHDDGLQADDCQAQPEHNGDTSLRSQ
jgi:hypothetical protein